MSYYYLGVDLSTQSLSLLLLDAREKTIAAEISVPFSDRHFSHYDSPNGFLPTKLLVNSETSTGEVHADPRMWLEALDLALDRLVTAAQSQGISLSQIKAIGGSGQQHGSVFLNSKFQQAVGQLSANRTLPEQLAPTFSRPTSPIWMDTSTTKQCREIAAALPGGDLEVCARSGSKTTERFTGPQIRKYCQTDPVGYSHTAEIHLVSSFLSSVLAGRTMPLDFGDAAGMNLMNLESLDWDDDLLAATAQDLREKLPDITNDFQNAKVPISSYFVNKYGFASSCEIIPFTGDNPASLVGMGATKPGQMVVSLGTSDTLFAALPEPKTDPQGYGHVFGNPGNGGFMSLICFRNGSLAREALREELGLDTSWEAFDRTALSETIDSAGVNITLPFYGPEITPRADFEQPVREFSEEATPGRRIRSLLEGQFLNMNLHSKWMGVTPERIRLTGGAAQNDGIAQIVADVFGVPVERLELSNSATLGAALIAAASDGYKLDVLQNTFCQPLPGSEMLPQPGLSEKYSTAMVAFEKLLGKYLREKS